MLKHGYGIALTTGFLLLLAAGLLLLAPHGSAASDTRDQRLRIQDALVDLGPCLTCHSETTHEASRDTLAVARTASERDAVLAETAPDTLQDQLDARLVTLGYRLLDLPEAEASGAQAAALMDDYLYVYESTRSTRADAGRAVLMAGFSLLDGLEQPLADLEAQAAPVRLAGSAPTAPRCDSLPARAAPPSIPAAGPLRLALASASAAPEGLLETHVAFVQAVSVVLVHRRGPPSHGAGVESVL